MYKRKHLYVVIILLITIITTGCGSDNINNSGGDLEQSVNNNYDDEISKGNLTKDEFIGFWSDEDGGPIQITMDNDSGSITYINGEENTIYTFEKVDITKDTLSVRITGMEPVLDKVIPYILELNKTKNGKIELYNEFDRNEKNVYTKASEEYIAESYNYNISNDNEEIESFEEENDVNVVSDSTSNLKVTEFDVQNDLRIPDIVVFEYASPNLLGRQILESFFGSKGWTYYYQESMNRFPGISQISRPIEERDYRIDIVMDYEIEGSKIDKLREDILLTTPFKKVGSEEYVWYYSFALPKERQELYVQLEEHIREIMANGQYEKMAAQVGRGSSIILPEGMEWKEFIAE